jgi:O-antigen ligase
MLRLFFVIHLLSVMSKDRIRNVAIIIVAILMCGICLSIFSNVQERLLETFNTGEQSSKYHFAMWLIALKTGYNNIITGIGLGNMAHSYGDYGYDFLRFGISPTDNVNVHNYMLQIWSEQGILGIFASFFLFFSPIICYVKCKIFNLIPSERKLYDFIFLGFIGTLTYNLTNNNFYIETFWILAGMVYAAKDYLFDYGKVSNTKSILSRVSINTENCS